MPVRGSAGTEGKGMSANGSSGGRRAERTSSSRLPRGTCARRSAGVRGAHRCAVRAVRAARGLREWGWRCAAGERVRAAVPGRLGAAAARLCAHLKAFAARRYRRCRQAAFAAVC